MKFIKDDEEIILHSNPSINEKYIKFVNAYLDNEFNAKLAAIEAGYSPKSAASQGSQMLQIPEIAKRIRLEQKRIRETVNIDRSFLVTQYLAVIDLAKTKDDRANWIKAVDSIARVTGLDRGKEDDDSENLQVTIEYESPTED